jgi:D-glycero-D-manno-heptose 1,7-bisphosphate phosphatase
MLLQLADLWRVDLARSYMVGDAWTDIAAGRAANCRSILVRTGRGAEQLRLPESRQYPADHVANDLAGAVDWLLQEEGITLPIFGGAATRRHAASAPWTAALAMGS